MDENSASFLLFKLETHGAVSSFSYVFMSSFKFSIRFRFIYIIYNMYFRCNSFKRGMRSQSGPDPLLRSPVASKGKPTYFTGLRLSSKTSSTLSRPENRKNICNFAPCLRKQIHSWLEQVPWDSVMKAIQVTPYGLCSIFLSRNFTFQCLRVFCRKIACKTHPIVRHKLSCRAEVECKFQIMLMNTSGTDATCHHHKL